MPNRSISPDPLLGHPNLCRTRARLLRLDTLTSRFPPPLFLRHHIPLTARRSAIRPRRRFPKLERGGGRARHVRSFGPCRGAGVADGGAGGCRGWRGGGRTGGRSGGQAERNWGERLNRRKSRRSHRCRGSRRVGPDRREQRLVRLTRPTLLSSPRRDRRITKDRPQRRESLPRR